MTPSKKEPPNKKKPSKKKPSQKKRRRMSRDEVVRLVELFEGEVNNGGFHQFFYNSTGNETAEIIQALETIGARKVADVVRRAAGKFPGGMPPKDRFARQDLLLDRIDPEIKVFDELDNEFYSDPGDLQALLERYAGSV
ncbi:MAG: DMP19 family protein [Acidobacteriia bacterium]|jgi:hypothetical protein|nr:DMP19 family protein [Terriglobia bacterium]